jgi:hypothetical protein
VTGVVYLHPKARWGFARWFEVWGGPLLAAAPEGVVDPYTSHEIGALRNTLGGAADRTYLGTELDLGLRARWQASNAWVQLGLQGAAYIPGPALRDAFGERDPTVWAGYVRTELRY